MEHITTRLNRAAAVAALAAVACSPARFVRTDDAYQEAEAAAAPAIFADKVPERAFRTVGLVEVTMAADADAGEVRAAAMQAGQRAGCQFLVEKGAGAPGAASAAPPLQRMAWIPAHEDHGPPAPRERDVRPPPPERGERSSGADNSASGGRDGASGGPAGRAPAAERRTWQFLCGVYAG